MINIYHSRRGKFRRCRYWKRDTSKSVDLNQYKLEKTATGIFYAIEINNLVNDQKQVSNVILFDKNTATLQTEDEINDISKGCIVEYLNEIWYVESCQFVPHIKEGEFSNKLHTSTIINIRR